MATMSSVPLVVVAAHTMLLLLTITLVIVPVRGDDADWMSEHPEMDTSQESVQQSIVDQHNAIRCNVTPPARNMLKMVWNSDWEESSRKWINNCSFTHRTEKELKHHGWQCGENIFMSPTARLWEDALHEWELESEKPGFEFGFGALGPGMVGHYTQLVWYQSFEVGCAVNYCPSGEPYKYFYLCTYCPGGNLKNRLKRPYDKGAPCEACPDHCDDGLCTNPCLVPNNFENCNAMRNKYGCGDDKMGMMVRMKCGATCTCSDKIY
ncbi:cysteine-rich venom protein-like isoform X1 [Petromyzon marinus]|uniref:cysteine-rich venom protein-like isoform X1 n=3 Tax=Petromyzon marinus TaxID=7757 RepID=UPI003F711327